MIPAEKWRKMTVPNILDSIDVAFKVLSDMPMTQTDMDKLFTILSDIASEVRERVVDKKLIFQIINSPFFLLG